MCRKIHWATGSISSAEPLGRPIGFPYQFVRAFHAHIASTFSWACCLYEFRHRDPSKERGGDAGCSPGEAFAFSDLILFLPSVSSADERDGASDLLVLGDQLTKCEGEGPFDESGAHSLADGEAIGLWTPLTLPQ